MRSDSDDKFFERWEWAKAHGAANDRVGRRVVRILHFLPHDPWARQFAESRIHYLEAKRRAGELPPFIQSRLHKGDLVLGQDIHGSPIRIKLDWLCSGFLTIGSSGSGKSNLLFWILSQIAWLKPSVFIFEPYKQQSRLLLPLFRSAEKPLVILPWRKWRWNLLQCAGCDPRQQVSTAVDLLVRTLDLPGRAAAILRQGIYFLYNNFGVWDGGTSRFPTLFHLYEWVKEHRQLNAASREAILDRLGAFLLSLTPACGAWTRCWSPGDLSRFSIVFETRGASESVRNLLPQSLLFNIFNVRIAQGLVNTPLELLLVFEDAQRIFSDRVTTNGEVTPLDEATGIVRGAGLGIWPIAQTSIGFSRRTRPNMAIRVFGRCGCHDDYVALGADCGLDPEQLEYVRHYLVPGTFVGQVGLGTHTLPFVFRVPLARLPHQPTDDEIEESLRPLRELPTEFEEKFADWKLTPSTEIPPVPQPPPPPQQSVLDEASVRFLKAVVGHKGRFSSAYTKLAGLGAEQAVEIRARLVEAGLLVEHRVTTGTRGRQAIILEPTPAAYEALGRTGGAL